MSGGVWVASYVALWVAVLVLGLTVVALLRQIGVLHARLAPMGVHFAGEGPDLGAPAPSVDGHAYRADRVTLVAFTSPSCEVCRRLEPSLRALARTTADLAVVEVEAGDDTRATFSRFNVSNTPYLVAVDGSGIVRGRGVANSMEQVEELLTEARAEPERVDL